MRGRDLSSSAAGPSGARSCRSSAAALGRARVRTSRSRRPEPAKAWGQALGLVRKGGTVVLFGGLPAGEQVPFDAYRLHYDELTVCGAFHHTPQTVRAALVFVASGAYPWRRLLTHEVGLEGVAALFEDPPREYLKAIVRP